MNEEKILELIFATEHLFLLLGMFATLLLLKWVRPIKEFLFSDHWKWLIAPINLGLSTIGIFLLDLTDFTSTGMKVMLVLIISALTTFGYEAVLKYIVAYIEKKIKKILNNN